MKFKFPFEKILRQRELVEEEKGREFAEAQWEYDQTVEVLEKMYKDVDDARGRVPMVLNQEKEPADKLVLIEEFIVGQEIRITRQQEVIREKLKVLEEKREFLKEAAVQRKIMDTLKDRQKENFRKSEKKREEKISNDRAVMRFGRGEIL